MTLGSQLTFSADVYRRQNPVTTHLIKNFTQFTWALRHFKFFVEGVSFHILTDHKRLEFAMNSYTSTQRDALTRRLAYTAQFTSAIWYTKGSENVLADSLGNWGRRSVLSQFKGDINAMSILNPLLQLIAEEQNKDPSIAEMPGSHNSRTKN